MKDPRHAMIRSAAFAVLLVAITAMGAAPTTAPSPSPATKLPPKEKLSDAEVATLEQWIKMGAPDPRDMTPEHASKLTGLTDAARAHWAYQPVKLQPVPTPSAASWVKSPIDAFVLAKLDQN